MAGQAYRGNVKNKDLTPASSKIIIALITAKFSILGTILTLVFLSLGYII